MILRILPAILVLYLGGQWFIADINHGHLAEALHTLLVPFLVIGFVAWREWKIVRDPKFAARQARKESSAFSQARLAGAICLGLFLGIALLLLGLTQLYPHMLDGIKISVTEYFILLYAGYLVPIAVAGRRYFWVRVSGQP
jgi:uncharacterized membrane protein